MSCRDCKDCRGLVGNMVKCGSVKHARFMDELGGKHHQTLVHSEGGMALVSSEALHMDCSHQNPPVTTMFYN